MKARKLFIGISTLVLFLTACGAPAAAPTSTASVPPPTTAPASPTVPPPTAPPSTPEQTPDATTPPPSPTAEPTARVLPNPEEYTWRLIASGLRQPTDITGARDGSNRLFVLEKVGRIRVLVKDELQTQPFLDITDRVGSQSSEQGLLGLAFHPNFVQNGYFYVYYTDRSGDVWISRFTANGATADSRSEKRLLTAQQPYANHNGGALRFGPDGYLYIGLGDGGSQGDPFDNAQAGNSLLGKILRIDVDNGDPYAIPADNPFVNAGNTAPEIWALGLRNPWKIAFDLRGFLWIADVGQNEREEINRVPGGDPGGFNFGWNEMEGTRPYEGNNRPEFTLPVAEYTHSLGCSVTGGETYTGNALPAWQGIYLFGDFCSGNVWGLPIETTAVSDPLNAATLFFQTGFQISTFGLDDAGEIYLADYSRGNLYRLEKK